MKKISNELKIKDAIKKDTGKGTIRIDPKVMSHLGLKPKDVIEVTYPNENRKTAGNLAHPLKKDSGTNIIRLDQDFRISLNAHIDNLVSIRKIEAVSADKVEFETLIGAVIPKDSHWLAKKLENRIITSNNTVIFYDWGHKIELNVINYLPKSDAVRIQVNTEIILIKTEKKPEVKEERKSAIPKIEFKPLTSQLGASGTPYRIQLGLINDKWVSRILKGNEVIDSYVYKDTEISEGFPNQNFIVEWVLRATVAIPNINLHQIIKTTQALVKQALEKIRKRKDIFQEKLIESGEVEQEKVKVFQFNDKKGEFEKLIIEKRFPLYELLNSDFVLLFIDPERYRVWIWHGSNTSTRMKFISAKLAPIIRDRLGIGYKISPIEEGIEPRAFKQLIGLAKQAIERRKKEDDNGG